MRYRVSLVVAILMSVAAVRAGEPVECYLVGRVTDEQGEPVPATLVRVSIGPSLLGDEKRMRTGTSDRDGNYSVALPPGHARLSNIEPAAGYFADRFRMSSFATSREQPLHNVDFVLRRGPTFTLDLSDLPDSPEFKVSLSSVEPKPFSLLRRAVGTKQAEITLPPHGGRVALVVWDTSNRPMAVGAFEVQDQFRPDQIKEITPLTGERFEIRDAGGHKATLSGGQPASTDGRLTVRLIGPNARTPESKTRIAGRIVDARQKPLAGARICLGFASRDGSGGMSGFTSQSGADGKFALEIPAPSATQKVEQLFFLVVTFRGTSGKVTTARAIPAGAKSIAVAPIELAAGHALRVRVVGEDDRALEGAWVQAGENYLSSENFAVTDSQGRAEVSDLAAGTVNVHATYGSLVKYDRVVIVPDSAQDEVRIRLTAPPVAAQPNPLPEPSPVGSPAPEWSIVGWTDGRTRKLSDYRGKVVVLDFWGIWCSACLNDVPAVKEVAARYGDNPDVVFLGIHSAGTDMSQVKKLQKLKDWQLITGIDQGTDTVDGLTARAYGARGWPTQVIIDRDGKIAFNSNLEKWNPITIALEHARIRNLLKISPPKPGASVEDRIAYLNKIGVYRSCELIDRALKAR